ncbi:MAG TPA: HAMP domain-containing sensor histidine kinase [Nitrososphaeraceae archaeon]|jgi:signal transduction histidine kinase|nr:HAMP domain-containing sensor histidine kinase [Nitrososphaeraceae archaeon]
MNYTRPLLAISLKEIWNAFTDAKSRGVKLRYLTEITHDNISSCKKLLSVVDELRHLDGVKGSFMINELQYLAPVILFENEKISPQIVCSTVKEIVRHQQNVFDKLWAEALSSEQRFREIEEGVEKHYQTRFLENPEEVAEQIKELINTPDDDWSICSTFDGLLMMTCNKDFEIQGRLLDSNRAGKNTRWIGTINKDNIHLIKAYLDLGMKIKHIKNIPLMNFAISSKELYATIDEMKGGQIAKNILISNEPHYVKHFKFIFEEVWKNGIDAKERIREIEEGFEHPETRVLKNKVEILSYMKSIAENADEQSTCCSIGGMQLVYNSFFSEYKKIVDRSRGRKKESKGVRWITSIDKDSIDLIKIFLDSGMQVRHVKNLIHVDFAVDNKNFNATIDKMEGGKLMKSLLISNEPAYVSHYNSIFEEIWKNGIDATERIRDIEIGVDLADIEVIPNSAKAQERYMNIVRSAKEEILWIFPTVNAFIRQYNIGAISLGKEAAKEKNVRVRILMPTSSLIEQKVQELKEYCRSSNIIDVRYIVQMSETKATILVVDRKVSLVMELKDDTKFSFYEAIGLSTYSNSKAGVLSYVAIFENLWKQLELYEQLVKANEQLKVHDKMQKEFINIAAHELRTPIQPILGLSEIILSKTKDIEQAKLLEVVSRNAKRLQRLTEDLLDVSKIESQALKLNKNQFNLEDITRKILADFKTQLRSESKDKKIKLDFVSREKVDTFVYADKARIIQVIHNLLDNAIKFTKGQGNITVRVENEKVEGKEYKSNHQVMVIIKDNGIGIDPQIMPRLFTKFATNSQTGGTGLGLFICKGIVQAHGGRIWAENNPNEKGASFYFSLPLTSDI